MPAGPGRPRDVDLDEAILAAARDVLVEFGPSGLTVAAVAERAGTTRAAVYRRFDDTDALAVAVIAELSATTSPVPTDDPYADLVAELEAFRRGITSIHGLALAGSVLAGTTTPAVAAAYRVAVVAPRRARLRDILDRGHRAGRLDASGRDRELLVTMCTGSWYAHALAGETPRRTWASDTAKAVWRAGGGV